jgi:hypothetical protein
VSETKLPETDAELLTHGFLNPKWVEQRRSELRHTHPDSPYLEQYRSEVAEIDARVAAEESLRARRDELIRQLRTFDVIKSKYGQGYVRKMGHRWHPVTIEEALELLGGDRG